VGAKIVTGTGTTLESATLVVRDGRIAAIGDVEAPPDAIEIDAAGWTLYPGFIDAHTELGIPEPERGGGNGNAQQGESTPNPGLRPDQRAALLYRSDGEALSQHRSAGFTAAVVAPQTQIFGGRSAVVSLANGTGILQCVFSKTELKRRKERIEGIVEGEAIGKAAKEVIAGLQAAVIVAAVIAAS